MNRQATQHKYFLLVLAAVSMAFGYIIWPYFGPVFWAIVLAILFAPVYRRILVAMHQRKTPAALATLLLCLVVVLIPLIGLVGALVREGATLYDTALSRKADIGSIVDAFVNALPAWAARLLDRIGIGSVADLQEALTRGALQISQFMATRALSIGQNTLEVVVGVAVMLYLLFFLLRDGAALVRSIRHAVPLAGAQKERLFGQLTSVIRATVKGNVVVAIVQGMLGGAMLWALGVRGALLWGAVMAVLSMLPVVGSALVWAPIAIWFLVTGAVWKGAGLIAFGVLVIGLVDNILRPLLVGRDTKMPDYLVLISTLGGIAVFGLNGFVIGPLIAALFVASWGLFANADDGSGDR
jgi:predicted PurR-regulated permease PerM